MNLDLWKIFYEVANAKTISKASEKLHISQPAITKQIHNLEEYLNTKLFLRSKKGVILTTEGENIYNDIKNGLNSLSTAEKKIKDNIDIITGTIRIGVSTTLAKKYLMPYINSFHKLYPGITFEISTDPTNILKENLKKGSLDFIIAKFPLKIIDDFQYEQIGTMQDIFIASKEYPELINKKLNIKDLLNYQFILQRQPSSSRDYIDNYCYQNHIKLKSIMEIASANLLIEFVKIGYGIGVVTKEYVLDELKKKEIFKLDVSPKILERKFGIITMPDNYLSHASAKFHDYLFK